MHKKPVFLFVLLIAILILTGCSKTNNNKIFDSNSNLPAQADSASQPAVETPEQSQPVSQADLNSEIKTMTTDNGKPQMIIDQKKSYTAVLHTTAGDIELYLNVKATPITVNNFIWLAKKDFYNNTVFHRVISGFMIQGGDPKGDGTGGPGYTFADEPFTGEYSRGTIAMANAGPNTNGSQFFIMHQSYPLQKDYVIFGRVTKGLEVVDQIADAPVQLSASGEMSAPLVPVKITSVEIIEK